MLERIRASGAMVLTKISVRTSYSRYSQLQNANFRSMSYFFWRHIFRELPEVLRYYWCKGQDMGCRSCQTYIKSTFYMLLSFHFGNQLAFTKQILKQDQDTSS